MALKIINFPTDLNAMIKVVLDSPEYEKAFESVLKNSCVEYRLTKYTQFISVYSLKANISQREAICNFNGLWKIVPMPMAVLN